MFTDLKMQNIARFFGELKQSTFLVYSLVLIDVTYPVCMTKEKGSVHFVEWLILFFYYFTHLTAAILKHHLLVEEICPVVRLNPVMNPKAMPVPMQSIFSLTFNNCVFKSNFLSPITKESAVLNLYKGSDEKNALTFSIPTCQIAQDGNIHKLKSEYLDVHNINVCISSYLSISREREYISTNLQLHTTFSDLPPVTTTPIY